MARKKAKIDFARETGSRHWTGCRFWPMPRAKLFREVDRSISYGTHAIFIGRVYSGRMHEQIDPFLYHEGGYSVAGPAHRAE